MPNIIGSVVMRLFLKIHDTRYLNALQNETVATSFDSELRMLEHIVRISQMYNIHSCSKYKSSGINVECR